MLNQARAIQDDQWLQSLPEILDFDLVYFDDISNASASLVPASQNYNKGVAAAAKQDK